MEVERRLAHYISNTTFENLPQEPVDVVKNMILTVLGTTIAGADEQGCDVLTQFYSGLGGKEESTVLIRGKRLPAEHAAFVNSYTARAVDYCDAMAPGMHIGASAVPTALAAAELGGGCTGKEFLAALVLGTEIATRLNLTESAYSGLDPTGVCAIFAATTVACKMLRLDEDETLNALALAFNRSGGSLQSNIDASLAVRCIQGWASQNAITCVRYAKLGITGPENFLEGVYGYFHLYAKDEVEPDSVLSSLGERFGLQRVVFKKYPSCGLTQGCTEAILKLVKEHQFDAEGVDRIEVRVPPYTYHLVGRPFETGDNPRVNAQFSIQYCTANALLRNESKLHHFDETYINDPTVRELVERISVVIDADTEERGHTALDMHVFMSDGKAYFGKVDIPPGFPGNPLTKEDHEKHFWDCVEYSHRPFSRDKADEIIASTKRMEEMKDARSLIPILLLQKKDTE